MKDKQKITFTIMGSGSAYGVPTAGNGWGVCDPDHPANRRLASSVVLRSETDTIIIDLGPDFRQQTCAHNVREISGVLFTHSHADHITGIFELPKFTQWQKGDIHCFATPETLMGIQQRFHYLFDPNITVYHYGGGRILWHEIEYGQEIVVGDMPILPFQQDHGFMSSTGFRVGDIAYSTDVKRIDEANKAFLKDLKVWVLDCNGIEVSPVHNHLDQALAWIKEIKPERAILTHLSETIDYVTTSKKLPPNVELAVDGMSFETFAQRPTCRRPLRQFSPSNI